MPVKNKLKLYVVEGVLAVISLPFWLSNLPPINSDKYSLLIFLVYFLAGVTVVVPLYLIRSQEKNKAKVIQRILKKITHLKHSFFIRDLLIFLTIIIFALIYFYFYSLRLLTFIWPLLPVIVAPMIPVLVVWFLMALQSILFLHPPKFEWNRQTKTWLIAISLFFASFLIYRASSNFVGNLDTPGYAFFPELAQAFLEGSLNIEPTRSTKDLTLFNDNYYVSFPPLAAILMLPTVANKGHFAVNTVEFNNIMAAFGVMFVFLMLESLSNRGWSKLPLWANALLAVGFGFGTAQFYMASTGIVVHLSQVGAATFLALSLWILTANQSADLWPRIRTGLLAGLALGLSMLARPHVGFASILLMGITYQHLQENENFTFKNWLGWGAIIALPILIILAWMGWYNHARFGSYTDFGYGYMLVADFFKPDLAQYGQFNLHYFWQNFQANFLNPPIWDNTCKLPVPQGVGMSIFLTTPVLVFLFLTIKKRTPAVIAGWLSIICIALVHLLYYNSGSFQFGYRFSMDFIPASFFLLPFGIANRNLKTLWIFILWSLVIGWVGVLFFAKLWCITY